MFNLWSHLSMAYQKNKSWLLGNRLFSPLCEKIKQDLLWWNIKENRFDEDYWKYR